MAEQAATQTLTHVNEAGDVRMVDVSAKHETKRSAIASCLVRMKKETLQLILADGLPKGDVLATARIAGIMAAKRTSDLIPMCHPLAITHCSVQLVAVGADTVRISGEVCVAGKTGVEMEALTAVSVAALTLYDMCKAVDKGMIIEMVQLDYKEGGKSGTYQRQQAD